MEKSWIPMVKDGRLFIVYSFDPIVVYEYLDGAIVLRLGLPEQARAFVVRGGTQLIPWRGNFVGLVHSRVPHPNKLYYTHAFVVLDDKFELVEMSEPFFLQRRGLEFACGLIEFNGDLLVSYGVSDRAAAFCILPFKPISQWVVSLGARSPAAEGARRD
jgi:hypothetical protein